MTRYEFLLYLHIASAILWLGAGFLTIVHQERAFRAQSSEGVLRTLQDEGWLAPRLFIPAALSTLVLGILLVLDGGWGFGTPWVLIGLGGFASTFVTGLTFLKPSGERVGQSIVRDGRLTPDAMVAARKRLIVGRVDMAILFTVVFDMAAKPEWDEALVLIVVAAALVAVAVVSAKGLPGRAL